MKTAIQFFPINLCNLWRTDLNSSFNSCNPCNSWWKRLTLQTTFYGLMMCPVFAIVSVMVNMLEILPTASKVLTS